MNTIVVKRTCGNVKYQFEIKFQINTSSSLKVFSCRDVDLHLT